ncbi:hypothetical protein Ddc_01938 [Ditylenchus destructor]|nr:hypothetical protein Ddc_01938 [Ditylenchus destructor]
MKEKHGNQGKPPIYGGMCSLLKEKEALDIANSRLSSLSPKRFPVGRATPPKHLCDQRPRTSTLKTWLMAMGSSNHLTRNTASIFLLSPFTFIQPAGSSDLAFTEADFDCNLRPA